MSAATNPPDSLALQLTEQEKSFLERQLRSTRRYALFTAVDLVVAVGLTAWWALNDFGGTRFALIVLVLLHARANLKQHKGAVVMAKLKRGYTRTDHEFVNQASEHFEKPTG